MTTLEAVREYLLDCEARNLSEQTLRWYREKLGRFLQFLESQGVESVESITPSIIREFLHSLRGSRPKTGNRSSLSGHTLAGFDQVLRAFFRFLVHEGVLTKDPMSTIRKTKRPKTEIASFTQKEVRKMLSVYAERRTFIEHRNYVVLLCFFDTAIRLSELTRLELDDVELDSWFIRVRHGKGGKERRVPIGKILRQALGEYIPRRIHVVQESGGMDSGALFCSERGRRLSSSHVYRRIVRQAGEQAGVRGKRISPHTWRHLSAVEWIRAGGDPFSLQARLGHSTMDMVRHYVQLSEGDVRRMHRRYSPLDNHTQ